MDLEKEARKCALKLKQVLKSKFITDNFYLLPSQLYLYNFLMDYKEYPSFLVPKNKIIDLNQLDQEFIILVKQGANNSLTFSYRPKTEPGLENEMRKYLPFYQMLRKNLISDDKENELIKWYSELKKLIPAIHNEIYNDLDE